MTPDRVRRGVALALPVVAPVLMSGVFAAARRRFGDQRGYVAGFVVYWAGCFVASLALLGRGLPSAATGGGAAGRSTRVATTAAAALLAWPPSGAIATRAIPDARSSTAIDVLTSVGVAAVNTACEELLWRDVYVSLWPDDPWRGWVWPAIGFGLWHVAPQVIRPSSMGTVPYIASATALGLSWGWVARQPQRRRWVALSHLLTDASGLRNARYFRV